MKAFHGKQEIKDKYLNRMLDHIKADELIQGTGFDNGKGCFIGCTLNNYDHPTFEAELGIPISIAKLSDRIFEGLSKKDSIEFAREYYTKIKPGADLSLVTPKILLWILSDPNYGVIKHVRDKKFAEQKESIENVIDLLKDVIKGDIVSKQKWRAYAAAAYAASAAADAYAAYAASAADTDAASAADASADAAAYAASAATAADAAYAADAADAADAAAAYADAAAYAAYAYAADAARRGHYKALKDKLFELFEQA